MSRIAKLVLVLVVLLFGLIFHAKNNQLIQLNYYIGSIELSLSLLVVLFLCLGALLGVLASMPLIFKLKRRNMKLEKQIKCTEKEINTLRVLPVKD